MGRLGVTVGRLTWRMECRIVNPAGPGGVTVSFDMSDNQLRLMGNESEAFHAIVKRMADELFHQIPTLRGPALSPVTPLPGNAVAMVQWLI